MFYSETIELVHGESASSPSGAASRFVLAVNLLAGFVS